ncbi:MAG: zinc-ribbon domain-containing protein, partial [Candidatus Hermodarchaeota archaeon]
MSEIKFCQFCGSEVSPGDSYCLSCGQMISGSRALT